MISGLLFRKVKSSRGQATIIIMVVAAFALIFYAAIINLGRMSQVKTVVTVASNLAVAELASDVASYGQQLYQVYLDGNKEKCGLTGAFAAMIGVLLAIVGTVIAVATGGAGIVLAVVGLSLAAGGFVIETAVVEPGISRLWNAQLWDTLDTEQIYIEQAIQNALQNAVTDPVKTGDYTDMNVDCCWIGGSCADGCEGEPEVSRFSVLYQHRIKGFQPGTFQQAKKYINRLRDLLYDQGDGWGLTDKPGEYCSPGPFGLLDPYANGAIPSECNPCCVPEEFDFNNGLGPEPVRPLECGQIPASPLTSATCLDASAYELPFVFDLAYENPWDDYRSFSAMIGRDDEHPGKRKGHPDPNVIPQLPNPPDLDGYYFGDTTGYYPLDLREGNFDLFHRYFAWGLSQPGGMDDKDNPQCMWCDPEADGAWEDDDPDVDSDEDGDFENDHDVVHCAVCNPDLIFYNIDRRFFQLELPPLEDLEFETNYFVDGPNHSAGDGKPPVGTDNLVPFDDGILDPAMWLAGADRYGNGGWKYHQNYNCFPPGGSADDPNPGPTVCAPGMDLMDRIVYRLEPILQWAIALVNNQAFAARMMKEWCWEANFRTQDLLALKNDIIDAKDRLKHWRDESYKTMACDQVWCIPTDTECTSPAPDWEQPVLDSAGKMDDVAECLHVNASDQDHQGILNLLDCLNSCNVELCQSAAAGLEDMTRYDCAEWRPGNPKYDIVKQFLDGIYADEDDEGNAAKFSECLSECSETACTNLPRSLVPDFDPNVDDDWDGNCNPAGSEWAGKILKSAKEAEVQVAKFRYRRNYLDTMIVKRNHLIRILEKAEGHIGGFVDASSFNCDDTEGGAHESAAAYGWKDPPAEDDDLQPRWHIVQVTASLPAEFPKLRTYTKAWGMRRCYHIPEEGGIARVAVTRYDEPIKEGDEGQRVSFGAGPELWEFRASRPDVSSNDNPDATNLDEVCILGRTQPEYPPELDERLKEAFIVDPNIAPDCWGKIQELMNEAGVRTETCAQYVFQDLKDDAASDGFTFQFTRCP